MATNNTARAADEGHKIYATRSLTLFVLARTRLPVTFHPGPACRPGVSQVANPASCVTAYLLRKPETRRPYNPAHVRSYRQSSARTPGELHYVACVEEETHTVDARSQKVIVQRTAWGYYFMWVTQYRAQLLWTINLRRTVTLESVAKKTFGGGKPPPFPEGNVSATYFYGSPPAIDDLVEWLLAIIK